MAWEFEEVVDFVESRHFAEVGVPLKFIFGLLLVNQQLAQTHALQSSDKVALVLFSYEAFGCHNFSEKMFPGGYDNDFFFCEFDVLEGAFSQKVLNSFLTRIFKKNNIRIYLLKKP